MSVIKRWIAEAVSSITAASITDASASGATVLTGTPAQARQAIGAAAGASGVTGYCYVDATLGNDSTGARNSPALPFATIAAAITAASAGDVITVTPGGYAKFTVSKSNLSIIGAGPSSSVITHATTDCGITISDAVTDTLLWGLGTNGGKTTTTDASAYGNSSGVGILIGNGCHRTTIERCRVINSVGHNIFFTQTSNYCSVLRSSIENVATAPGVTCEVRYGLLNFAGSHHQYRSNFITGSCQGVGLWFGAKHCIVSGNRIVDNWGRLGATGTGTRSACEDYGSAAWGDHGYNLWENNYVSGTSSHGFEIAQGTTGSIVRRNYVTNVSGGCVEVTSDNSTPTTDILVEDNTFIGGGGSTTYGPFSINGVGAAGIKLRGGLVYGFGSGQSGCLVGGTATGGGFSIEGVTFEANSGFSIIRCNNCGDGVSIVGCKFIANIIPGALILLTSGNYHSVVGCSAPTMLAYSNQRFVSLASGNGHLIKGNSISRTASGSDMIIASAGSGHNISGNSIAYNAQGWNTSGINLGSGVSNSLITDNVIIGLAGSPSTGINLDGTDNRAPGNMMVNCFAYVQAAAIRCSATNGADVPKPVVDLSAAKTFGSADMGVIHRHPAADTTARTWTIDANSTFKCPIGTVMEFYNEPLAGTITVAIATDTLTASPAGTTGSYSLLAGHKATATKVAATSWVIEGN